MLESVSDLDQNAEDKAVTSAGGAEEVQGEATMGPVGSNPHNTTFYKKWGSRQPLVAQGEGTMQRQGCPARTRDTH